jgi:hypothetical protein
VVWGLVAAFALAGGWLLWRAACGRSGRTGEATLVHLASLWLPLVGAVALLYGLVAVGLLDRFELYPATPKDPVLTSPHWPAVVLWLVALAALFALGRWAARSLAVAGGALAAADQGRVAAYGGRRGGVHRRHGALRAALPDPRCSPGSRSAGAAAGVGRWTWPLLAGGLVVYALFYFMGFAILRIGWNIFWYLLLMMFSIGIGVVLGGGGSGGDPGDHGTRAPAPARGRRRA